MIGKYYCEICNWQGDRPEIVYPEYEDGGYKVCPVCGDPVPALLNLSHPDNMHRYAQALGELYDMAIRKVFGI